MALLSLIVLGVSVSGAFWYGHGKGYAKRDADYQYQVSAWNETQTDLNARLESAQIAAEKARTEASRVASAASDGKTTVNSSIAEKLNAIK